MGTSQGRTEPTEKSGEEPAKKQFGGEMRSLSALTLDEANTFHLVSVHPTFFCSCALRVSFVRGDCVPTSPESRQLGSSPKRL